MVSLSPLSFDHHVMRREEALTTWRLESWELADPGNTMPVFSTKGWLRTTDQANVSSHTQLAVFIPGGLRLSFSMHMQSSHASGYCAFRPVVPFERSSSTAFLSSQVHQQAVLNGSTTAWSKAALSVLVPAGQTPSSSGQDMPCPSSDLTMPPVNGPLQLTLDSHSCSSGLHLGPFSLLQRWFENGQQGP